MRDSISNFVGDESILTKSYQNALIVSGLNKNKYNDFSIILHKSIEIINEKYVELSKDRKSYIICLFLLLIKNNIYLNIEETIEKYLEHHKNEYNIYSSNWFAHNEFYIELDFIKKFVQNLKPL